MDPIGAFGNWYHALSQSQQIQIAVHLCFAVPNLQREADLDQDPVGSVMTFLRQPIARPIELLGRIGLLKAIVEVCFCIPASRNAVEAAGIVSMAILTARYATRGDEKGVELARLAGTQAEKHQEGQAEMYLSWSELVAEEGPLSAISLYEWLLELSGRTILLLREPER
jgi:hypothetical protein